MITKLRFALSALFILAVANGFAQVPIISYVGPQLYTAGTAIPPLSPANTGGAAETAVFLGGFFPSPGGIAIDAAGNIYITDDNNNNVSEIPAGGGDAVVIASGFELPRGIASDAAGNLFVANQEAKSIVKVAAVTHAVTTLVTGFDDPIGIAIDATGNLFVSDPLNGQIMKVPAGGSSITTIATALQSPVGLTVDAAGNIYFAEAGANRIREILATDGSIVTLVSGLNNPVGVAIDATDNIYIADGFGYIADGLSQSILEAPAGGGKAVILYHSSTALPIAIATSSAGQIFFAAADDSPRPSGAFRLVNPGGYTISPALPSGLSINLNTGVISGTSMISTPAINYTITASNTSGSGTAPLTIRVKSEPAGLLSLALSAGTLSPAFATNTTSYTADEIAAQSSITITPRSTDTGTTITVNGTPVASGTASAAIPLSVGANNISVVVKSYDGTSTKTYTVTATRATPSSNDNLASLTISNGTLTPAFATATTSYTANVGNTVAAFTVTPTVADTTATITVNGTTVTSGSPSANIPLSVGANTINIIVTAQDGTTTQTYTLVVNKAKSQNADLSNITLSSGMVSPVFVPATTSYTAIVDNSVSSITLTPTVSVATSTVTVNGTAVASGSPSASIPLTVGTNTITTIVTAQDGTTKTYTVSVTRSSTVNVYLSALTASNGVLIPDFSSGETIYNVYVGNLLATMTLTPTSADPAASITVNGSPVTSGSPSSFLPLTVGENTFNVVLTGSDGTTTLTYTVIVHESKSENNYLFSLTTSSGFSQGLTVPESMAQNVRNETNAITVTPTVRDLTSTITVNGSAVASGSASASLPLNIGANTITIVVTAQDQRIRTYSLTVTRAADAKLSGLSISKGTLNTPFSPDRTMYSAAVAYGVPFSITPTEEDPAANIMVNGTTVSSGAAVPVTLTMGENTINIVVTGSDAIAAHTYTLTVNEARSGNPDLFSVRTSSGIKQGRTVPAVLVQTVPNDISSTTVTPTVVDAPTAITVNGTTVESGSTSGAIPLTAGDTTAITIATTAQTGAGKTYTLKIVRLAPGPDNNVYQPVSVDKPTETPQLAEDGINVHQGVSPNGDGINDFLQIDNIANYPDNHLSIMSSNGQLVYEARNYDNATKAFDGHNNKTGQMQLPGTYFYSLDYTVNGTVKHKTGFLVLKY